MAGKSSTFQISLKLLTQQFTKGLNNVQKQLKSFGNFVKGAFAIGSIVSFGRKMIETGAQFEDAMAKVQAVSNATAHEMDMMTKEAEKLGATTKYTAVEAAGALENLTRNGLSASDATQALSGTLKLAQANAIGLAEAADIITNTMNIFGLSVKDTNRINDVLSATCANSATNINLLSEAIYGVGPIANMMGKSIEETSAALGLLANKGVKGSEAGKALGSMFQRLASQSPKAQKALAQYGLSIDESTLKSKTMTEVLQMLADSGIGNSIGALSDVFGKNFAKTISILINDVEKFNEILGITQNAAGTTARMFEQGVGSTENAIKSLQSAYDGLMNSIFKQTSGVLNSVLKGLTNLVRALSDTKTRATAVIGTVVSLLSIRLVKAMQKVRLEAAKTRVAMTTLKAGITAVSAAAKAAYAAMGGWVGILVTIGSAIVTHFVSSMQKAREEAKLFREAEAEISAEVRVEEKNLKALHDIVADNNQALSVRKRALEQLKSAVRDYHGELSKEGKLINDNEQAIYDYIKALKQEMTVERKKSQLKDLYAQQEVLQAEVINQTRQGLSEGDKSKGFFLSLWSMFSTQMRPITPGQGAQLVHDKNLEKANQELSAIEHKIALIEQDLAILNFGASGSTTTPPITPDNGDENSPEKAKKNADDKLAKAKEAYAQTIREIQLKYENTNEKEEDLIQEEMTATKNLIDAYIEHAAAIQNNANLESDTFKNLIKSYADLEQQTKDLAAIRKAEKDREEARKTAVEELERGRARFNAKDSKSQVKNPWDEFSSNPKEYRDEERAVEELQNKLENLISTYENLKDKVKDIGTPTNDKEREVLNWWTDLKNLIAQTTEEYQRQANALGSKKAMDEINQKTIDQRRAYYDTIRNTSSAVGQLTSNLQSLSEADWGTMSFAEKFNTISNAIFGTIDAVLNVIDTFRSLQEIIESLQAAKTSYALIEEATSKQQQKNAEAEGAAALAKGADELAAAQMSMIAGEVDKEVKRGVVAANSASAISGAAAAMASIPYVGPFLATAAATEMEALLAAMLPKFASGGIIQGNSKYGDRLLARVNAGEMILNKSQQSRLFDIANGHGGLGVGQVSFHIAGKDLVGVLRNNNAANAKISGAKGL